MVRSIFKLALAVALISAGVIMTISGMHGILGAAAQDVHVSTSALAVPSGKVSAEIVGYGTDKDTYDRGDTANGYITLKNTGDSVINDATVRVTVSRSVPVLGTMSLGAKDLTISGMNLNPGDTKKSQFSVDIPKEYSGFSTAGNYQLDGRIIVNGKDIGGFSKSIKVV